MGEGLGLVCERSRSMGLVVGNGYLLWLCRDVRSRFVVWPVRSLRLQAGFRLTGPWNYKVGSIIEWLVT